jgi:methylenetetrahydrofolate--tRNA-(uracil-5-)-methyltransferase
MSTSPLPIHVIGGGLAGSEAAWQIASAGVPVVLHEMRPVRQTEAHQTDGLAEMVCSNSFRSDDAEYNAVGLLHEEMRRCDSLILRCADAHRCRRAVPWPLTATPSPPPCRTRWPATRW